MNPIQPGFPALHTALTAPINNDPPSTPSHPALLDSLMLSPETRVALKRFGSQPSQYHQSLAKLLGDALDYKKDSLKHIFLHLHSTNQAEAHYQMPVDLANHEHRMSVAQLTTSTLKIRTELNYRSEYDIIEVSLYRPSSGETEWINFPGPRSDMYRDNQSSAKMSASNYLGVSHASSVASTSGRTAHYEVPPHYPEEVKKLIYEDGAGGILVNDPDRNDSKSVSITNLRKRLYSRRTIEHPRQKGVLITRGALRHQDMIPDPRHEGQMITRSKLNGGHLVKDPDDPEKMITQRALNARRARSNQKARMSLAEQEADS